MKIDYCFNKCNKGMSTRKEILDKSDSVFDALTDFQSFAEECYKDCPYKAEHERSLKVCCISAKARHGKDTAAAMIAEYLESKGKRVLITHYADLLKFICKNYFGWDGEKDEKGRTLLQYVGTDVVGKQTPEFWAEFIVDVLKFFPGHWDFVLIPDCRYPWEVSTMEENFDTVVLRVERHGFESNLTEEQKKHASEVSMDNYPFDAIIYNDSDLDSFRNKVEWFADNYLIN